MTSSKEITRMHFEINLIDNANAQKNLTKMNVKNMYKEVIVQK